MGSFVVGAGRVGAAGEDCVVGRGRGGGQGDRGAGRSVQADRDCVEEVLRHEGIGGLVDRPKPGRPAHVDEVAVVSATLEPPPERLGVTHWSSRLLAKQLGISHVWVGKIWRKWDCSI
ncbi:MAG TPA: hypothetical protein VE645_05005 [Pseudonocardiaceae bacterium]|nr:hypothetical protein [Pseudonocardiaceae bacterium]